jgi:hypothetical protein
MKYEPRFYLNGVGIHHKTYLKEKKTICFYTEDLRLHSCISDVRINLDWVKCAKLFGDSDEMER